MDVNDPVVYNAKSRMGWLFPFILVVPFATIFDIEPDKPRNKLQYKDIRTFCGAWSTVDSCIQVNSFLSRNLSHLTQPKSGGIAQGRSSWILNANMSMTGTPCIVFNPNTTELIEK
uniref:Secreted protein n=1 Tax=Heterorhabditis bacteriophora TaxID=37862 RepID=A0A1I7WLL1_HETBA